MAKAAFTKQTWESWIIATDFSDDLQDGETISLSNSIVSATDKDGEDATDAILDPSGKSVNGPWLQIRVVDGVEASQPYNIRFQAITSLSNKYEFDIKMVVRDIP